MTCYSGKIYFIPFFFFELETITGQRDGIDCTVETTDHLSSMGLLMRKQTDRRTSTTVMRLIMIRREAERAYTYSVDAGELLDDLQHAGDKQWTTQPGGQEQFVQSEISTAAASITRCSLCVGTATNNRLYDWSVSKILERLIEAVSS